MRKTCRALHALLSSCTVIISIVCVIMYSSTVTKTLSAALYLIGVAHADGIYSKSSAVLQFDGKSYDKLIAKSNLVSVS